jgi:DNA-binding NarL/FixJ family response regulator
MVENGLRVVLAEDDLLLREGLASLLERSGFQVVGQAGDATTLLTLVDAQVPELVVVDIRMPPATPPRAAPTPGSPGGCG